MIQIGSLLCRLSGVGLGVFIPNAIWSVAGGCGVPIVFGFPAYGGANLPGALLWNGQRSGAVLALVRTALIVLSWSSLD